MKALLIASAVVGASALGATTFLSSGPAVAPPETVTIPAGTFRYRPPGEYRVGRKVVDAPVETRVADRPLVIMKYPVSRAAYAACVAEDACTPSVAPEGADLPQTDVSYADARAYAAWLSRRTGQRWRLPTDAEWARAAGERMADTALGVAFEDPSVRWLAEYGQNVQLRREPDLTIRPRGAYGANAHGVVDMSGNVWEWTESCFRNVALDEDGNTLTDSEYCGVRAAEGRHRAFIIDFVRDAKAGGCAAGLPPDHLGFRLVRE